MLHDDFKGLFNEAIDEMMRERQMDEVAPTQLELEPVNKGDYLAIRDMVTQGLDHGVMTSLKSAMQKNDANKAQIILQALLDRQMELRAMINRTVSAVSQLSGLSMPEIMRSVALEEISAMAAGAVGGGIGSNPWGKDGEGIFDLNEDVADDLLHGKKTDFDPKPGEHWDNKPSSEYVKDFFGDDDAPRQRSVPSSKYVEDFFKENNFSDIMKKVDPEYDEELFTQQLIDDPEVQDFLAGKKAKEPTGFDPAQVERTIQNDLKTRNYAATERLIRIANANNDEDMKSAIEFALSDEYRRVDAEAERLHNFPSQSEKVRKMIDAVELHLNTVKRFLSMMDDTAAGETFAARTKE